jgi:enterochelin esterase family protein
VTLAIRRLLEHHEKPDAAAVDEFLRTNRPPIVEGPSVTFLYRGEAQAVRLRHFISGFPRKQPFHRVDGSDLWFLTMEVPGGSRFEYKIDVRRKRHWRLIRDPLNPRLAHDPFGANSVCHASGYETPDWIAPDEDARRGELETVSFRSGVFATDAELRVYLPPRMRRSRMYPLLVAFDGEDYLTYSALRTVLDNLIHRYEIPPLIVALSSSPDRFADYTASEDHARFVVDELLPHLQKELPLRDRPADRGMMGASLGAVAAFWTAWREPGLFGRLLLQSGSFRFTDTGYEEFHPALGPVVDFVNAFRERPTRVVSRVFVSCGRYEGLIDTNRALVPVLRRTGMQVHYVESRDGHNWENWRDQLRLGLGWLFPGPLGLVYE